MSMILTRYLESSSISLLSNLNVKEIYDILNDRIYMFKRNENITVKVFKRKLSY